MKSYHQIPAHLTACALLAFVAPAHAATMSASPTAPPVTGEDIANYGTINGNDKWFAENTAAGAAKGQTFTTGSVGVLIKAITYQVTASQEAEPTKTYVIRVGKVTGTSFTEPYSETATQTFTWNGGEYMTWTLDTPRLLLPNTTYGIDVGMTNSTSTWQTGIPYINVTANAYTNGQRYSTGTSGVGTNTLALVSNSDRIFHLDLQHPMAPSPESGTKVPAGNVTLSWTNLAPNSGTDVWVDVWFGTAPGSLSKVADKQLNLTSFIASAPLANTYYWRIDSYLDGAPTGTPVQSSLFNFIVTDSDGDGFPDAYELAHTNPSSPTALNVGDDLEPDGLTNWQEYQLGTNPNNPDTDSDTLNDGPEIAGVGSRPPTNPLLADTDADGLSDGVETNTGTWSGSGSTGTNPANSDTDTDGLKDGVETNTGVYVSTADTGTSPLNANSDGDNAGDWYEVAIIDKNPALGFPPNSPNSSSLKPNIPYPLPAPDASTGATNKPVKVYIMSGQSNMVGFGTVNGSGPGTLQTMTGKENKFPNLVASGGGWTTRQDVKYRGVISDIGNGLLKPDVAGTTYGPELGFGYVMGWYHDEPVLLIKASQGNRGLMWDLLPPGSPRTVYGATTFPAYGESPETWATTGGGPTPFQWYAGKQYDDFFLKENDMGPSQPWAIGIAFPNGCQLKHNGVTYVSKSAHTADANSEPGVGLNSSTYWNVYSVFNTADILDDFANQYPSWAAQGFEIAGYVWWQGYDDTGEPRSTRYEPNMVQYIKQLRAYFENRYNNDASTLTKAKPNAPFVLATLATNGGWGNPDPGHLKVANAQLAVDGGAGNHAEFAGNVKTIEARGFWRDLANSPSGVGYHYNFNAETYLLVGDALGRAMVSLESNTVTPGGDYATWSALYPGANLTNPAADLDGDGLTNDAERIFGLNPTTGASSNPISVPYNAATGTLTYTRRNPALNTGVTYRYEWSATLAAENWQTFTPASVAASGASPVESVTITLPAGLLANPKLFIRVVGVPN